MSFEKKQKVATKDARPQANQIVMREQRVKHLKDANTPEARAVLKKMNDKVYRGARTNLTNWWAPKGLTLSAKSKVKK